MELQAFVRVFGLYGAREVARRAGDALQEAVGGLHSILAACRPVLQGLLESFQVLHPNKGTRAFSAACMQVCQVAAK
jgi:hypothetical protein